MAPIGVQGVMHPDGDIATATAARNLGVPFTMSTAGTRSIEAVAEANGTGHRYYQLYWYGQSVYHSGIRAHTEVDF